MVFRKVTPAELADHIDDWLASENLVILGGPWVGKSHIFEERPDTPSCYGFDTDDGPESIAAVEDISPPIVFDDFYAWYQGDPNHERWQEVFAASNGVGLVTRPRRFEWLLKETNLDSRLSDRFRIVYVRYPKRESDIGDSYCAAIEECCRHSKYDRKSIKKNISKLHYEYTFDYKFDQYESYLPFLVYHDCLETFDASGGVFERIRTFGRQIKDKDFVQTLRDRPTELGVPAAVGTTGVSVAALTGQPVVLGVTFTLLLKLHERREGGDPRERIRSFLGPLADERFLPHSVSVLEEELDLPPGTIEVVKEVVTDRELFDTLQTILEIDDQELEELMTAVESFEDDLDEIQTEIEILSNWIDKLVGDAVRDPEWLAKRNRRHRISMLQEQGVPPDVAHQVASPFGKQALRPDRLNEAASAIKAARDTDTDGEHGGLPPCFIVRGPRGIGKTSFVCRMVNELSEFDAGVVDATRDPGIIESRLDDKVGNDPFLLIYKHDGGSIEKVRRLLADRLVNDIDALVIEVTDSLYPDLVQAWDTSPEGGHDIVAERFERMVELLEEIQNPILLEPLDEDRIEQLVDPFDFDPDSDQRREVLDASDGFPLLAIVAGSLVTSGDNIEELSQQRLFVRHLENAIKRVSRETDDIERVLETLAVVRYVPDFETLFDAADVSLRDREAVERFIDRHLRGYVRKADRGYQLTPEIYTRLLFQRAWFRGTGADLESAGAGRDALLADLYEEYPEGLGGCAANLGGIWYYDIPYSAAGDSTERLPQPTPVETVKAANELVEFILSHHDPGSFEGTFAQSMSASTELVLGRELLRRLLAGGIPLSPDDLSISDMFATYIIYMELQMYLAHEVDARRTVSDTDVAGWISGQVGFRLRQWIANHLVTSIKFGLDIAHEEDVERLCTYTRAMALELESLTGEIDPVAFISGVYALAVTEAINRESALVKHDTIDRWFDIFESELETAGEEFANHIKLDETETDSVEEYMCYMFYTKVDEYSPENLETRTKHHLKNLVRRRVQLLHLF